MYMFSHAHFHVFPHSRPVQGPFPTSVSLEASAMPGVLAACRLPNSKTHGVVVSQAISHNYHYHIVYYMNYSNNIIVIMVKPRCRLTHPFPSISSVHSFVLFISVYMCDGQNSIHVVRSWHRFIRPPIATHSPSTLFTN